jgi:hypothetical protein
VTMNAAFRVVPVSITGTPAVSITGTPAVSITGTPVA